jgi:tetratricopeptide (TPR) repeat protein
LQSAQRLENEGKYEQAVALYEEVSTKYRKSESARTALFRAAALYEEKLDNWRKSAALLQELRTLTEGKPEAPQVLLRLGRVLEHGGSPYTDALLTYGVICKECAAAPESVAALLSQGRINESLQRWGEAERVYEEAIEKLGDTPESATVKTRLQSVWLLEALGTYFSGGIEEGAALAEKALKKGISYPEVRQGLEDLLRRFHLARSIWKSHPGRIFFQDYSIAADFDSTQYLTSAGRGRISVAPKGWDLTFNDKRKNFILREKPAVALAPSAGGTSAWPAGPAKQAMLAPGAGKVSASLNPSRAGKRVSKRAAWVFRSPVESEILGIWWSSDSRYLGWVARARGGVAKEIRILDLKERRSWQVARDQSGGYVGDTVLFLPRAGKVVFPYGYFLAISDLRGGNRVQFLVRADRKLGAVYKAKEVEWLAATADGVSLAVAVRQEGAKKDNEGKPVPARMMYWKFNLSTNLVMGS